MANGLFAGGNGTAESPYLIEDAHDLNAVRNNLTAHYKLINDIDLGISPYIQGEGWVPIGDYSTSTALIFKGVFDGNGHVIKNLFINRPSKNYQGLFGRTEQATIKNIGVEDVNVTGGGSIGGLVGYNNNSSIINSYSTGSVTGSGSQTGGLVGYNYNSSIINSYSTGSVTGGNQTGGLVGYNHSSSVIENSYSTGSVTGGSNTGGLVGLNNTSSIINSYWDKETSGYATSAGGTGKTTIEMQTPSTFVGWENETLEDGTSIWILQEGEYPKLWFEVAVQKILIKKSDGVYVYYDTNDSKIKTINHEPTVQDFLDFGMDDVSIIPKTELLKLTENSAELIYWTEEESPSVRLKQTPHLFLSIGSELPTSTEFLKKGMDELTPLLDRKVTELAPMDMEDKTSILFTNGEVGKVYQKTIDLQKYFDIRSIKTNK